MTSRVGPQRQRMSRQRLYQGQRTIQKIPEIPRGALWRAPDPPAFFLCVEERSAGELLPGDFDAREPAFKACSPSIQGARRSAGGTPSRLRASPPEALAWKSGV